MLIPRYDIFLSYSRADTERVAPLRDELRRLGYRVFFDTQSIDPGEHWKLRLDRSIRQSRTLVLCWSEHTRGSDYITFEYSRAEALNKQIYPWLLDKTPLPAMLEIQGITTSDPVAVAAALRPALGWTLPQRRRLQSVVAAILFVACVLGLHTILKPPPPPPPWTFEGQVLDPVSRLGIANVEVDGPNAVTRTDAQGNYTFHLPPPQPPTIHLVFRAPGYGGEEDNFPTGKSSPVFLTKVQ